MRKALVAVLLAVSGQALAGPIPPIGCPNCLLNSPTPQQAQVNLGTAVIRGTLTVGTLDATNLSIVTLTATNLVGSGAGITALNASALASGTVPSARLAGAYIGITSVGTIAAGDWRGTPVAPQYGGTGQNWSAVNRGALPFFNGTGAMSTLPAGTVNKVLQAGGAGADPSWTATPTVLGTNVTGIPLANLQTGNLPSAIKATDASLVTVSGSKVSGDIGGNAANINGTLPLVQLGAGTLPTSIAASSITPTGVAAGTYPATTNRIPVLVVSGEGRVTSASQSLITLPLTQLENGTLPSGVLLPAASVADGNLSAGVVAQTLNASGVTAGTYGGPLLSAQITVNAQGRVTSASQLIIPSVSTRTAWTDQNNFWHGNTQDSISSWTFHDDVRVIGTLSLTNALAVTSGGTGKSTLAAHGVLLGQGAASLAALPAMGALGLVVGNGTSVDPSTATLTGTSNQVTVTQSATSITLSLPQSINSGASPTFTGSNFTGIPQAGVTGLPAQLSAVSLASTTLDGDLTNEVSRAMTRENNIGVSTGTVYAALNSTGSALTIETSARASADSILTSAVNSTGSAVTTETAARILADSGKLDTTGTAALTITGAAGYITTQSSSIASAFFGDASHMTGIAAGGWSTAAGIVKLATISDNVGVGTITPSPYKLNVVAGDDQIRASDGTYSAIVRATSGGAVFGTSSPSLDSVFMGGGTEWMRIKGGKLGIGTASPAVFLDIQDGNLSTTVPDDIVNIGFNANYGLRIGQLQQDGTHVGYYFKGMNAGVVGSTIAFVDTINNYFGIGTDVPASMLDVRGAVSLGADNSAANITFRGGVTSGTGPYMDFKMGGVSKGLMGLSSGIHNNTVEDFEIASNTKLVVSSPMKVTGDLSVYGAVTSSTTQPTSITCNAGTASFLADSNNQSGRFTNSGANYCDIVFSVAYPKKPVCFCNVESANVVVNTTNLATTGFRCSSGGGIGGYTVSYFCWGAP